MGYMKELDLRIRNGGDDAVAAALELMPEWIPVAERKPPEGRHLVVHRRGPHTYVDVKAITYDGETGAMPVSALTDVSHWMPLPEPPG